jgi:hypothetical protein
MTDFVGKCKSLPVRVVIAVHPYDRPALLAIAEDESGEIVVGRLELHVGSDSIR